MLEAGITRLGWTVALDGYHNVLYNICSCLRCCLYREECVMVTAASVLPLYWTAADLHEHLGHIPLQRIRLYPPPGTASLADVLAVQAQEDRLCELVDGVLVEKTVGYY